MNPDAVNPTDAFAPNYVSPEAKPIAQTPSNPFADYGVSKPRRITTRAKVVARDDSGEQKGTQS